MEQMEADMNTTTSVTRSHVIGSVPSTRPEGVFRGMSVQLNNMATAWVRNRKARQLTHVMSK
jgi:RNase P protein component